MPDYRKKRVSRIRSAPKRVKKSRLQKNRRTEELQEDIKMRSYTEGKSERPKTVNDGMRVVKGKKLERRRRLKIVAAIVAVIAVAGVLLEVLLPVGIGETVGNALAVMGSGKYPIDLESTETLDSVSKGAYYYLLSDTRISAVSSGGKQIFSDAHGFENPVMKTSSTRAMVFDQGGNTLLVYNLSKQKIHFTAKSEIISAGISRCGTFAVVTRSDSYAATVSVYDKNSNLVYEWYSSEDMVNDVVISPNGKKIAVSTLNAAGGKYKSNIYVLTFDSANPVFSESFEDTLVYKLDCIGRKGFAAVSGNKVEFISWGKYTKQEYSDEYSASMFRAGSGGYVTVFNRESDRTDNHIAVFSASGELKYKFNYNGVISDISVFGGHIYCMSDTSVCVFNDDGSILRSSDCGYGGVKLAVIGTYSTAVISDSQITKLQLKEN